MPASQTEKELMKQLEEEQNQNLILTETIALQRENLENCHKARKLVIGQRQILIEALDQIMDITNDDGVKLVIARARAAHTSTEPLDV